MNRNIESAVILCLYTQRMHLLRLTYLAFHILLHLLFQLSSHILSHILFYFCCIWYCIIYCLMYYLIYYRVSYFILSFRMSIILCIMFNTFLVSSLKLKLCLKSSSNWDHISIFKLYLILYFDFKPHFTISHIYDNTTKKIKYI